MRWREYIGRVFRIVMFAGLLVLAYVYRQEISQSAADMARLDTSVILVLPLFVLWNYLASIGWRALHSVLARGSSPSAWRLSMIRLQAQALNLVLPLASVGGEVLRATMLSRHSSHVAGSTSAVVLDKIADSAAGVAFSLFGIMVGFASLRDGVLVVSVLGVLLLGLLAFLPLALLVFGKRIASSGSRVARALTPIVAEPRRVSRAFYKSLFWHLSERILTGVEIFVAMLAVGLQISPVDALFVSAVMTAYTLVFFFVPGQIGAAEAGVVSAFASLGLPGSLGLTVALVRRARQLLVIAAGAVLFMASKRRTSSDKSAHPKVSS